MPTDPEVRNAHTATVATIELENISATLSTDQEGPRWYVDLLVHITGRHPRRVPMSVGEKLSVQIPLDAILEKAKEEG